MSEHRTKTVLVRWLSDDDSDLEELPKPLACSEAAPILFNMLSGRTVAKLYYRINPIRRNQWIVRSEIQGLYRAWEHGESSADDDEFS